MGKQDLSMLPGTSRAGALRITRGKTVQDAPEITIKRNPTAKTQFRSSRSY